MTKKKPSGLDFPDMPKEFEYIWRWFVKIANAGEVNLLTIESFSRLMKIDLSPSEVNLILEFDLVQRRVQAENLKVK